MTAAVKPRDLSCPEAPPPVPESPAPVVQGRPSCAASHESDSSNPCAASPSSSGHWGDSDTDDGERGTGASHGGRKRNRACEEGSACEAACTRSRKRRERRRMVRRRREEEAAHESSTSDSGSGEDTTDGEGTGPVSGPARTHGGIPVPTSDSDVEIVGVHERTSVIRSRPHGSAPQVLSSAPQVVDLTRDETPRRRPIP